MKRRRRPPKDLPRRAERTKQARHRLPVWKKAVLSIVVTAAFFVVLEVVLLAVGVTPHAYQDDPYVGFSSSSPLFVEQGGVMARAANKGRLFNYQEFPAAKARGAVRVFCVGGSTTYGRPYGDDTSFCGWLRRYLPAADPSRHWEVVNAGGISYASYRVAVLMEELIRYQPDLFIIYSGHNEFLERRTYPQIIATPRAVRGLGSVLSRTRTWAAVEAALEAVSTGPEPEATTWLGPEVQTLLDDSVGPDAYSRDDELRDKIVRHFRFNLARMVDIARSAGARVILVTPASNLRHCRPFKSEHSSGIGDRERARWQIQVTLAKAAHAAGRHADGLEAVTEALTLDDRHAFVHFLHGQVLDELGRHREARAAFQRARDEDVCTLRAPSEMEQVVREVAAGRQVPLVDFVALVGSRAAQGIPGKDLFLDHVHPTIGAHRLLALALLEQMEELGLVDPAPSWGPDAVAAIAAEVEASLDPVTHGIALMNLSKVLGWAGKLAEADDLARRAVSMAPDDTGVQYQAGLTANLVGDMDRAIHHYRRAVELEPDNGLAHGNLGVALEDRGELRQAVIHLRRAITLGSAKDRARNRDNLARALVRLGYESYVQGRYPESVRHLGEALELDPDNADTMDKLGVALLAINRVDDAIGRFRSSLELSPEHTAVRNRLAVALAYSGQLDEAEQQFLGAVRGDVSLLEHRDSLVRVLVRLGHRARAERLRAAAASIIATEQTRDGAR